MFLLLVSRGTVVAPPRRELGEHQKKCAPPGPGVMMVTIDISWLRYARHWALSKEENQATGTWPHPCTLSATLLPRWSPPQGRQQTTGRHICQEGATRNRKMPPPGVAQGAGTMELDRVGE